MGIDIIKVVMEHGGANALVLIVAIVSYKAYINYNGNGKISKDKMNLRIEKQKNECTGNFTEKIRETETKILQSISKLHERVDKIKEN